MVSLAQLMGMKTSICLICERAVIPAHQKICDKCFAKYADEDAREHEHELNE